MQEDDETTAHQLHRVLLEAGHQVAISTIIRGRTELGWTFRGSVYCKLIRDVNKAKRLAWVQQYCSEAETGFNDVVWTDKSSNLWW